MKRKILAGLLAALVVGGAAAGQASAGDEITAAEARAMAEDYEESAAPRLFPWLTVVDHRRVLRAGSRVLSWGSYPEIAVQGDDYPVLKRALVRWSRAQKEEWEDHAEEIAALTRELEPASPYYSYMVVDRWGRIDDAIVSFALRTEDYSGGAHPQYGVSTENFDPETGERVPIDAVVTGRDILLLALADAFRRRYPGREDDLFEQDIDKALDIIHGDPDWQEYITWMLDANNDLVVFYNPYEIGPYSSGSFILTVRRDEFPEVFREDWPE